MRSAPTAALHAEPIAPSLSEREWVLPGSQGERRAHAFLILSRGGTLLGEDAMELPSPSLLWLPSHAARTVRVNAGARGYMLSADDDFLTRTISSAPEGSLLRTMMTRVVLVRPNFCGIGPRTSATLSRPLPRRCGLPIGAPWRSSAPM
jgi:hypothetical protein